MKFEVRHTPPPQGTLGCIHHVLSESLSEVGWKSIMITLQFELKIETKHFQLQTSRSTILPGTWNLRRLRTANLEKNIFIFKLQKGGIGPSWTWTGWLTGCLLFPARTCHRLWSIPWKRLWSAKHRSPCWDGSAPTVDATVWINDDRWCGFR